MERGAQKLAMRQRILDAADRLFYGQGIRAVGVDLVAAEAGISKRTLYNHFPSKDALVEAYLERRFRPVTTTDDPPLAQVLAYFDRIERRSASLGFRGCPFVNAVAEIGTLEHPASRIAQNFKEGQRLWIRSMLEEAGIADADGLASQIALLVDGAVAAALVRGDAKMTRAAREAARTLLIAAGARDIDGRETGGKLHRRRKRTTS